MADQDAGADGDAHEGELSESRRRVNALLETLLEDDTLSDDARSVLRHLQRTPEDIGEMDAEELGTVLLEEFS